MKTETFNEEKNKFVYSYLVNIFLPKMMTKKQLFWNSSVYAYDKKQKFQFDPF